MPEFADSVDTEMLGVDMPDLHLQCIVTEPSIRLGPLPCRVVGGRDELQYTADRLDPETLLVIVDEAGHLGSRGSSSRAKKA